MASRAPAAPRGVARFLAKPRGKPAAKTPPPTASRTEGDKPSESGKAAPPLKIPELLAELEEHFKQLAVRVTYEALGGELGSGGLCKVRGQYRVIIDKRTTPSERVAMLLPLLPRFAGDNLSVSPTLRDLLARLRPAGQTAVESDAVESDAPEVEPAAEVAESAAAAQAAAVDPEPLAESPSVEPHSADAPTGEVSLGPPA